MKPRTREQRASWLEIKVSASRIASKRSSRLAFISGSVPRGVIKLMTSGMPLVWWMSWDKVTCSAQSG